ncbi:tetraprenyl-beta-curcumene synthase family protein [Paenibacillus thermoaerophilus]|nr:tetraprenyl-beta-curcumene synthase family protein [Paenibacillus thermoaerophilus]TMV17980.1 tetraprenyl-beta-curcumene synthase family protein [Paenibacillus thermoaerophilus]
MYRVYRQVLPGVREALDVWKRRAGSIPDPELRTQALASIAGKEFHCQGGAVFAALHPAAANVLIPLIVALQTISDYLDNLCDRSTSLDPDDFRLLHRSMLDAVDPDAEPADYYALRRERDDGGYLDELVRTCQNCVRRLPSYGLVRSEVDRLVGLYGDLQVYKHIRKDLRETALLDWWERHRDGYPDIKWNEFAAAAGSTLAMFYLFTAAADPGLRPERVAAIRQAYFPYVCGLHILLDYLIDQEEDRLGGDLNFCSYYSGREETAERIALVAERAREAVAALPERRFHRMIIEGLLALYLSDPKVSGQQDVRHIRRRLMRRSPWMRLFFWGNSVYIRARSLRQPLRRERAQTE